MDALWLTALLVFMAAVFATFAFALVSEVAREWWRRRQVAKRLKPVLSGRVRTLGGGDASDLIRSDGESLGIMRLLGLRGLGGFLEQARLDWSPATFVILTLGLAFAGGITAWAISRSILLAAFAMMLGAVGPYLFAAGQRRKRFRRFEEEFPESIDLLTRAIRAGHPLTAGMQMVSEEGPPEVAMEFRRAFEEQRYGLPLDEALLGMVDRTNLIDVRIFSIAVLVQREVGGNLAEILENLAHTIRRRFYIRRQLRVYTAQGRMTGYALGALPIVVAFLIFLLSPEYIAYLYDNFLGKFLVGVAVVLQLLGVLWIRKIISIEI